MKDCDRLHLLAVDNRKAQLDAFNTLLQKHRPTPDPSLLGSTLNSLSLHTDPEDIDTFLTSTSRNKTLKGYAASHLSEKDQKILSLMALRRERKMAESEMSFLARSAWEEERVERERRAERNKASVMELVGKKKKMEEMEKAMRRNWREERLLEEKMMLERKIWEKHERVERRQKELCLGKKVKAEGSGIQLEIALHQEVKKQKEEEEEMERAVHVEQYRAKERRSEEKARHVSMERLKKLREERMKQELRSEAARIVREEVERRREEERMVEVRLSERKDSVRKERIRWRREWKRKMVSEKNERDKEQHLAMYRKVREEEEERLNRMRRKMEAKDMKAKMFREKREEAISRSRSVARTAAELRHKIRLTCDL